MAGRKVYCSVVEGLVYDDRCLFKLSKMIKDNKTCENCILRELEKVKSAKSKGLGANDVKGINDINDVKGINDINDINDIKDVKRKRKNEGGRRKKSIKSGQIKHAYSAQELSKLLGRSQRTIQDWAQKRKIPAHKVGGEWQFSKEEIDRWLSERKGDGCGIPDTKQSEELPEPASSPDSSGSSQDPLFCATETKEG